MDNWNTLNSLEEILLDMLGADEEYNDKLDAFRKTWKTMMLVMSFIKFYSMEYLEHLQDMMFLN